jgi:hypothetical protein
MFENRIRKFLPLPESIPAFTGSLTAFVACPVPLLAVFTPAHQSFVMEVYRRAQELTESQLRKPTRRAIPEFSLN